MKRHIISHLISISLLFSPYSFLCGNSIGGFDIVVLENLVPETSKLMTVADLNNVELLQDSAVKLEFLSLEFWDNFLADIA